MLADDLDRLSEALERLAAAADRRILLTVTPRVDDAELDRAFAQAAARGALTSTMKIIARKVG